MAEPLDVDWRSRLGGTNAITLPAWLLTLPGAVVTPALTAPEATGAQVLAWFALGFLAHLISGAVLLAGRLTVLPAKARSPRPWAFVTVVVVAGLARGLFIAVVAFDTGLADSLNLVFRLVSAPATLLLWFSIATLIVDSSRRHRLTMHLLASQLEREAQVAVQSAEVIQRYRDSIVLDTKRIVAEQLEHSVALSADPDLAASQLRKVADEVIRPLSHELNLRSIHDAELIGDVERAGHPRRVPLSTYVRAMVEARPFRPALTALVILGTSVYVTILLLGPVEGIVAVTLLCAFTYALSRIAQSATARAEGGDVGLRSARVLGWWIAISLFDALAMFVMWGQANDWMLDGVALEIAFSLTAFFLVAAIPQVAVAAAGATSWLRESAEASLQEAAETTEWMTARLRQQAYLEKRQISRVLHGEVQARIVSMALQIQLNPPADSAVAMRDLSEQISAALGAQRDFAWADELARVAQLWTDAIDLMVTIADDAVILLDADPTAARSVVEVVREAITNAVRHGGADAVTCTVAEDDSSVVVVVTNDGIAVNESERPGLGCQLFDAVCIHWEFVTEPMVGFRGRIAAMPPSAEG